MEQRHGIDPGKAASFGEIQRDARTLGQRFAAAARKPERLGVACFLLAGTAWFVPALVDVAALGGAVVGVLAWWLRPELPFKLPATYPGLDPHEREPGTGQSRPARGLLFLGNDRVTHEELYLSDEDARTHFLVLGGTGSGKTEAMTGFCANTLLWGSGFTYVDGKGDAALWTKVLAMARACGREDDVYVLNYLTGSTDVDLSALGAARLSNTFNPFLHGSADALTQMLVAQMAEAGGDSATWKDKAIGLLTAYVRALVAMRDRGRDECGRPFVLDVGALRAYLTLDHLIDLYLRARDRVDGFALPVPALESLRAYLESVPGFQDPARSLEAQGQRLTAEIIRARAYPPQPDPQTSLQHGYLQNQFNRLFGQLADVYGHIFRAGHGEIDLTDVVLQRRILVVMLPALEKSPDELASLGKLLIASLKTMLAIGLGARLEGGAPRRHREPSGRTAPSPYLGVFDEYGYYAVKGFAVVPAQARSLGFSICFGGQDLQSFGKESREEAAAIVANTLTKVGMFIEDPKDTAELFEKLGGQALAVQSSGLTQSHGVLLDRPLSRRAQRHLRAPLAHRPARLARPATRRGARPARHDHRQGPPVFYRRFQDGGVPREPVHGAGRAWSGRGGVDSPDAGKRAGGGDPRRARAAGGPAQGIGAGVPACAGGAAD
jgi:intracellular multiplication protein IcmO